MNAPASASCLKWQPMVRRRTAAGHSCGAGQSAAPSTHLAEVAGSLPAPSPPRAFFSAHSVQNPFRSGSTVSGRPRSNLVKASQTWPCRLAPRPHDPRPRIQDPRPENGAGQARSSPGSGGFRHYRPPKGQQVLWLVTPGRAGRHRRAVRNRA